MDAATREASDDGRAIGHAGSGLHGDLEVHERAGNPAPAVLQIEHVTDLRRTEKVVHAGRVYDSKALLRGGAD